VIDSFGPTTEVHACPMPNLNPLKARKRRFGHSAKYYYAYVGQQRNADVSVPREITDDGHCDSGLESLGRFL
jgi:hypothetical protein